MNKTNTTRFVRGDIAIDRLIGKVRVVSYALQDTHKALYLVHRLGGSRKLWVKDEDLIEAHIERGYNGTP